MEIPLNVKVYCTDGLAGCSTDVVFDPKTQTMTHIVVAEQTSPSRDHLVPIGLVRRTKPTAINLACTLQDLVNLPHFTEKGHIRSRVPDWHDLPTQSRTLPHQVRYVERAIPVKTENLPAGQESVHLGAKVEATDGYIGVVEEFLVDAAKGHISHIVLRKGHLWWKKDVMIPVEAIKTVEEKTIFLNLDKGAIGRLPVIPTLNQRRHYHRNDQAYSHLWDFG